MKITKGGKIDPCESDEPSNGESLEEYLSDTGSLHSSSHGTSPTSTPLAHTENKAVTWSKGLVTLVLCIATTACAATTFKYTKRQEELDFQTRFHDFANEIISVYQINARNIIDAYETLSLSMTSYALGEGSEWPFVTIPKYAAQASKAMNVTGATSILMIPLVSEADRPEWEEYTVENQGWIQESYKYLGLNETPPDITPFIYGDRRAEERVPVETTKESFSHYAPIWQVSNLPSTRMNFDAFRYTHLPWVYKRMIASNKAVLSEVYNLNRANVSWPQSFMNVPIYADVNKGAAIVGILVSVLPWHNYFDNLVPEGIDGIHLVIRNDCKSDFSYQINGPVVDFLGAGDFHEVAYDQYEVTTDFTTFTDIKECLNTLHIYPSQEFRDEYLTNKPIMYMGATIFIFMLTALVFVIYDCLVERRQDKVLTTATRSNAIVSSLFPAVVQERLMDDAADSLRQGQPKSIKTLDNRMPFSVKHNREVSLHSIGEDEAMQEKVISSKPIADLFPNATVLFADIVGFTAWSSVREPDQVFTLLEGLYNNFDKLARRRKVFKVETIGDCYVAATGLPEKREDHAILMVRFARACLAKMNHVVRSLEVTLGPDTAELGMRIGLHSGPVTAGVLRGEKSRFQLFGDTVNTAARMESTGVKNKIQLSKDTADLIAATSRKDIWVKPRDTLVDVKGKGQMQTYWLVYTSSATASTVSMGTGNLAACNVGNSFRNNILDDDDVNMQIQADTLKVEQIQKLERLIDWNADVLQGLLKRCIATRGNNGKSPSCKKLKSSVMIETSGVTVLDEVREIITLPSTPSEYDQDPESVILDSVVVHQLRKYVSAIAAMYSNHPFHNFEHASHVTKSVTKLLARIVTSDGIDYDDLQYSKKAKESTMHRYTYGITSDPLTHFAVVFSALIHDADHPGVPNAQLVKEKSENAIRYKNKSIAEQNSVDRAWNLLMKPDFADLRACIYTTESEIDRFRQLVVNAVMATDIVDKELGALRRKRWERAFDSAAALSVSTHKSSISREDTNRKATIVIEHLIQASDVAHTMQHWHVYVKWNERLFLECYRAYNKSRAKKNPVDYWYEAELGFFDHYIIPLAKKLQECGVFGVASDEYFNYAKANRQEWELKGKGLVMDYVANFEPSHHSRMDSNDIVIK